MVNQLEIINKLKSAKRVAIISHVYPDGDAVGSSLALYKALRAYDKSVDVFFSDGVPSIYSFLPNSENVKKEYNQEVYDAAVVLDCGDVDRTGSYSAILASAKVKINIDHHSTGTPFGDINLVEPYASSTGEIIYRLIKMSGLDIDKEMAECLYVAIAADTGGFRFSNTTGIAMQVASDLINCGIDVSDISRRIFDVLSLAKVKLMGEAIHSLEIHREKIAVMYLNNEQVARINALPEDYDGIVNVGRSINGIEVAVFIVEKEPNEIKVNLRSNTSFDVAEIAQKFNGGGHKRAAGCKFSKTTLEDAKKEIITEILNRL
ncbi:MAG: DHH family phosphoesterase [Deltaproteobacteria bacterium]